MSLKVKDVIRELKKFPDDYKVALESYEENDEGGGYRIYNVRIVEKDDDADKMVLIKQLDAWGLKLNINISVAATKCRSDKKTQRQIVAGLLCLIN